MFNRNEGMTVDREGNPSMYNSKGDKVNAIQQRMATSYGTSQPLKFSSQSPARTG